MTRSEAGYPVVLRNLARQRCVVIGGGRVAERKVRDLLQAGARPDVISPHITAQLAAWRDAGLVQHLARAYAAGDLEHAFLAIAATNDRAVNAAVAAEGERRNILVNIVDDVAGGNFHTVAAVRRGNLLLAVSTSGGSPALSARIRRELEAQYGEEYALLLDYLGALRGGAARSLTRRQRELLWQRLVTDEVLALLRAGEQQRVEAYFQAQLAELSEEHGER